MYTNYTRIRIHVYVYYTGSAPKPNPKFCQNPQYHIEPVNIYGKEDIFLKIVIKRVEKDNHPTTLTSSLSMKSPNNGAKTPSKPSNNNTSMLSPIPGSGQNNNNSNTNNMSAADKLAEATIGNYILYDIVKYILNMYVLVHYTTL